MSESNAIGPPEKEMDTAQLIFEKCGRNAPNWPEGFALIHELRERLVSLTQQLEAAHNRGFTKGKCDNCGLDMNATVELRATISQMEEALRTIADLQYDRSDEPFDNHQAIAREVLAKVEGTKSST